MLCFVICNLYIEENAIHGVSTRLEKIIIDFHVRHQLVNARLLQENKRIIVLLCQFVIFAAYLSSLLGRGGGVLVEDVHDLGVQL